MFTTVNVGLATIHRDTNRWMFSVQLQDTKAICRQALLEKCWWQSAHLRFSIGSVPYPGQATLNRMRDLVHVLYYISTTTKSFLTSWKPGATHSEAQHDTFNSVGILKTGVESGKR